MLQGEQNVSLPGNKYHILNIWKSREFSFQRYENANLSIRCRKIWFNQNYSTILILFISQKPIFNYLWFKFMKEKRDNIENQTITTLFLKSQTIIRNQHILYNHILFSIIKMPIAWMYGIYPLRQIKFPWAKPSGNMIFLGGINSHISLTIMQ